ncbi:MAG: biopolymer transporter ExbD [Pseudomonadota bacterium]|nr:biopolymer transporter ExbD [Pseudomonadota bacterium]
MSRMTYGYRRRRRGGDAEDHILPLINIVFLLLSFFLIAGQITKKAPVDVTPPVSESEAKDRNNAATVQIDREGRATIDGALLTPEGLDALRLQLAETDAPLRVHADSSASAVEVLRVLQSIREAGWQKIELVTVRTAS